ncbi:MAG TPA: hypothetical protein VF597_02635 [Candidatus Saccharimonadales bacterium]
MTKIVLVIGEVTRNMYQGPRLEVLREGHKPKVVRYSIEELKQLFDGKYGDQHGLVGYKAMDRVLQEKGVNYRDVEAMIANTPKSGRDPVVDDAMRALSALLIHVPYWRMCKVTSNGELKMV